VKQNGRRAYLSMKEAADCIGNSVHWLGARSANSEPEHPDFIPYIKTVPNKQGHVMLRSLTWMTG
jgi:hypothetical protein